MVTKVKRREINFRHMSAAVADKRVFLFLQGPHGPFFSKLGQMLRQAGSEVWRVGFNAGDAFFWLDRQSYISFNQPQDEWSARFVELVRQKAVTDIVLYGDTRPIHANAISKARELGLCVHVFEEGYLRPYWVTYERNGSNGNSRLMQMTVGQMRELLERSDSDTALPPASWGDMREHIFYGALYHWFVMVMNRKYRYFKTHRSLSVGQEFRLYIKRLLFMPWHSLQRRLASRRIRHGGFAYHLVLLQLEHDASFQMHSPFATMTEFLEAVVGAFADGAPKHHHLVFKSHPLEDGRVAIDAKLKELSRAYGVRGRLHFVRGGKLAQLLNEAKSAVTVNSTAAQQVLWRGIPLKTFGDAVYAKPEFVSTKPLRDFFTQADHPDRKAYRDYRRYLLQTSQIAGGYYSAKGRRQLLRQAVDIMLSPDDPYDALLRLTASPQQQLRIVKGS